MNKIGNNIKLWLITGRSGSGKTTLTKGISAIFDMPTLSYSDMLTELTHIKGYPSEGDFIFNTPFEEFSKMYDEYAINRIEAEVKAKNLILIEGLCSSEGFLLLKNKYNDFLKTFFIDVPDDERMRRIGIRSGSVFQKKEQYKEKYGIAKIKDMADYVVNGTKTESSLVEEIENIIRMHTL